MNDNGPGFPDARSVVAALRPSYPVYCLRPEILVRNARRFISQFPGTVLYAVKCNPHDLVIEALYRGGITCQEAPLIPLPAEAIRPPGERAP